MLIKSFHLLSFWSLVLVIKDSRFSSTLYSLIPSSTQKEQSRLKGNHIKEKANQQVISPARIKEEQLSLLF